MTKTLILGDSISEGFSADGKFGWVQRLAFHDPENEYVLRGVAGDTILNLIARLDQIPPKAYDRIFVAIGINDASYVPSRKSTEVPLDQYRVGLEELLAWLTQTWPQSQIIFVGLNRLDESLSAPLEPDLHYLNEYAAAYDSALHEFATQNNIPYIAVPPLNDRPGLLEDGLHPSNEGHQLLYESISQALHSQLA